MCIFSKYTATIVWMLLCFLHLQRYEPAAFESAMSFLKFEAYFQGLGIAAKSVESRRIPSSHDFSV